MFDWQALYKLPLYILFLGGGMWRARYHKTLITEKVLDFNRRVTTTAHDNSGMMHGMKQNSVDEGHEH